MSVLTDTVLLIDNYDSFTYNLYQCLLCITSQVHVIRNDVCSVSDLAETRPPHVVISPGPKAPDDAGISKELIRSLARSSNILGVCLGHQCINEVFGGRTIRSPYPCHGKCSTITHDGRGLFRNVPQFIKVARYHSLLADEGTLPAELEVSARSADGLIMGLRHRDLPIEGVQFHPESFMTQHGMEMLRNYLERTV